jgi:CubicO group peptidase (beta-lactamase class C family)
LAGCSQSSEAAVERRRHNVENGLLADIGDPFWERLSLAKRMAHYNVPGVSIAVINDNQLEWARGYGVMEAGSGEPVTPDTLFQAASISKMLAAVAALGRVDQGALALDQDVNDWLVSWQVPQNEFTEAEPVTLRRLLSHSAGIYERAYDGYAQGQELPTLLNILNGQPPANSPPVEVVVEPGSEHIYANGGYTVVEQLLEDVSGESFTDLLQENVLDPWGMEASTYEAPLPEELRLLAAAGHHVDGRPIPGGWRTYPERAAASLWTTPTDLAQFAIRLMEVQAGEQDPVLSQEMAQEMVTFQIDGRGLGPELGDDGGDRVYFSHPGDNYGYKAFLVAYPQRGQGVVIMTNGENGAALWREILNGVSDEYGLVTGNTGLYVGILIVIVLGLTAVVLIRRMRAGS